jgi:hypothetical protein
MTMLANLIDALIVARTSRLLAITEQSESAIVREIQSQIGMAPTIHHFSELKSVIRSEETAVRDFMTARRLAAC